jgi:hypothetical protein
MIVAEEQPPCLIKGISEPVITYKVFGLREGLEV